MMFVPNELSHMDAGSMPGMLIDLFEQIERVYQQGWCSDEGMSHFGILHLDRAHRVSLASLQAAVGANPMEAFTEIPDSFVGVVVLVLEFMSSQITVV